MRCLIYQTANDRLHNVSVGISAFLWRQPETESSLAQGPGGMLRAYVDDMEERRRVVLRWGFAPAWIGAAGLQLLGNQPWPWVSMERAPSSRVFAHPLRYSRCLIPADTLYVAGTRGAWLTGPKQVPMFLAGVWDQGTFALLTAEAALELHDRVGPRMPIALPSKHFSRWLSPETNRLQNLLDIFAEKRTDWTPAHAKPAIDAAYSSLI